MDILEIFKKYKLTPEANWDRAPEKLKAYLEEVLVDFEKSIANDDLREIEPALLIGVPNTFYNSQVEDEVLGVFFLIIEKSMFGSDIAAELKLSKTHVELIQYILCELDICDYGTSPRGCFSTPEGQDIYQLVKTYIQLKG